MTSRNASSARVNAATSLSSVPAMTSPASETAPTNPLANQPVSKTRAAAIDDTDVTTSTTTSSRARNRATSPTASQQISNTSGTGRLVASGPNRIISSNSPHTHTPPAIADSTTSATFQSPIASPVRTCSLSNDCPSNICIQGLCVNNVGFSTSSSVQAALIPTFSTNTRPHRGKNVASATACSDPRCTLPADITSLNTGDDFGDAGDGSHEQAVSNAATAGIVLALLFVTLALLLVVPKIRDWTRQCFSCNKGQHGIMLDEGTPDFGNRHASTFANEKHRTTFSAVYPSGISRQYQEGTSDQDNRRLDVDLGQVSMGSKDHNQNPFTDRHEASFAAYTIPAIQCEQTEDITAYIEHQPVIDTRPSQPNLQMHPSQPWLPAGRDHGPARETVLPYTVDEDHNVLIGLKNLATPAMNESQYVSLSRLASVTLTNLFIVNSTALETRTPRQ